MDMMGRFAKDLRGFENLAGLTSQNHCGQALVPLAYRRDGGENHSDGGRLCFAFAQAVETGQADEIREHLKQYPPHPLVSALQAILSGSRDPALASDPALDYDDAVEVRLLLERLG